jgi:two-component system, chemotaxis family, sensor kinase CheA
MKNLDHLAATYREEAAERIAELEATLLELEAHPQDGELVDKAFRAMHTIKGSGAMFGFDDVAAFTHELETVFDQVRSGRIAVSRELVGLALEAKDLVRAMLDGAAGAAHPDRERLVAALRAQLPGAAAKPPAAGTAAAAREEAGGRAAPTEQPVTYRVRFKPHAEIFLDGTNPLGLLAELRELGACQVVAHTADVPPLEELSPESCHVAWDAILTTDRGENAIRDVFIFVEDRCQLRIELVDDASHSGEDDRRLGEILVERGDVHPAQLEQALAGQKRIGELLAEKGVATPEAVRAAVLEQQVVREERARRAGAAPVGSSIRVAADKLDQLVDLVGEIVIAQARLTRIASRRDDPELLVVSEDMERLTAGLRDSTLEIRMVPIGTTFSRFKRLVHDLAAELGKEIELVTEGAETELDKTVIERLGDPLVHVIRNSCGHGIEGPEDRRAAGKPARGTVRLSAAHSGASVIIEIRDDGAGLDADAIRAKAVERGLLEPDAKLSENELFKLIFLPGFSTARQVSEVSGRGVGMDVVKRSIDALRGTVEVESARGSGTVLRIKLPLTLAIIEGLEVAVGDASYVLPLAAVEECVELTREDVERGRGAHVAAVRGELVPFLRLRELFGVPGERPPIEQIAIVTVEGSRYGFAVDHVIGQHQTVIKSLGRMYRDVNGLSGATILGDGTVALIVDLPALVRGALAGAAARAES